MRRGDWTFRALVGLAALASPAGTERADAQPPSERPRSRQTIEPQLTRSPDVERTDTSSLDDALVGTHGLNVVHWKDLSLNRTGRAVSNDTMRTLGVQHPHVAFTWEKDDQKSKDWYPQGITGLTIGNTQKVIVVSWYAKHEDEHKGVRLSFIDVTHMASIRYRHVLLVEPSGNATTAFMPIKIHAGGVAAIGSTIFVADTDYGIRAFDAARIFAAEPDPTKTRVGLDAGKAYAFDYRYILPQVAKYRMNGPPFSFADIDWTEPDAPMLLTGTYHNPGEDTRPRALLWWQLQGDRIVGKVRDTSNEGLALKNLMQGASVLDDVMYLSCSGKPAHLYVGNAPYATFHSYSWPHGTEDLHVALNSGNLWSLSEHPAHRRVWAVKLADYVP